MGDQTSAWDAVLLVYNSFLYKRQNINENKNFTQNLSVYIRYLFTGFLIET